MDESNTTRPFFYLSKEGGIRMNEDMKKFRKEHDCTCCAYDMMNTVF